MSTTTESTRLAPPAPDTGAATATNAGRHVPDLPPGNSLIEVRRTPNDTTVRVCGPLTSSGHVLLGDVLDWIVAMRVPRCSVQLTTNRGIDHALLQLLRATRTRLAGALTVTADSPDVRTQLRMVGLRDLRSARP